LNSNIAFALNELKAIKLKHQEDKNARMKAISEIKTQLFSLEPLIKLKEQISNASVILPSKQKWLSDNETLLAQQVEIFDALEKNVFQKQNLKQG